MISARQIPPAACEASGITAIGQNNFFLDRKGTA